MLLRSLFTSQDGILYLGLTTVQICTLFTFHTSTTGKCAMLTLMRVAFTKVVPLYSVPLVSAMRNKNSMHQRGCVDVSHATAVRTR